MRGITVKQPYAWAIIHGGKNIENRAREGAWRPAVGQCIAIHAGMRLSDRGLTDDRVRMVAQRIVRERRAVGAEWDNDAGMIAAGAPWLTAGAVIGTVEVSDVHESTGRPGRDACCEPWGETYNAPVCERVFHLVLHRPIAVEPIPCKGKLGLWTVPDDIASRLGSA